MNSPQNKPKPTKPEPAEVPDGAPRPAPADPPPFELEREQDGIPPTEPSGQRAMF